DDMSCVLEGTNGFPGALTKDVLRSLGPSGIRTAFPEGWEIDIRCSIAYAYLEETRVFEGVVRGFIHHPAQATKGTLPLDEMVYLPDQDRMLGAIDAVTHRTKAVDALCAHLVETEDREQQERVATAERWSARSDAWNDMFNDAGSYVHHESGYERFDSMLDRIMKTVAAPSCLDIGCGTGAVSRNMAAAGAMSVRGIDISPGMVTQARISNQGSKVTFDVLTLPQRPASKTYDVIASRGVVISHLPRHQVADFLQDITRHAHDGTYAVFDFLQHLENGGFPNAGNKNELTYDWLLRAMRELGWVPVSRDGGDDARIVVAAFHRPFADSLYFVTGNPQKLLEMRHATDIAHLHGCEFDLPELKHDDIARIAEEKARQSYDIVGHPVISTDGGIFIDAYGGFPGPNSKQTATKLKPAGLLRLMDGIENRRAARKNAVTIYDGIAYRTDVQEVPCLIADTPRGTHPAYPMDRILVPIHSENARKLTYAEMPVEERAAFTELPILAAFVRENRPYKE
ncbi:MAG: hypothetical protein RLZZ324_865, partial [Candidatus Parcubacteria bacterium]